MAIQLHTVETAPFSWAGDDVTMMLRPLTPEIDRKVSRASGLTVNLDGSFSPERLAEHLVIKAHALIESWNGIEHGGAPLPVTRENVQWLADQVPEIIPEIVQAAEAKYAELLDIAGKSATPPSGTSTDESTATDSRSTVTTLAERAVSGGNAA